MKQVEYLEVLTPNREWVLTELEKLYAEWKSWEVEVAGIVDQPFDRNTQTEVFADADENRRKHEILQAKTLTFLNNNIKGHGFISGFDGDGTDRRDLRLRVRVKHRMLNLDMLRASMPYARVPEGFWKQKSREMLDRLSKKTGEAAIEVAASYLKNPFAGERDE